MAEIVLERKKEAAQLRVYIGAAPGVGKTYDMINDAYNLVHQQGVDLVIGLVESHGRKETEERIRDLEIVPQKVIPYRGVNLKEMDVDAILARHPNTVIVDELAHTNVPGSKNRKRYEDVLELLDAGINVMTAVNIQHLETLNDAVNRSAHDGDHGRCVRRDAGRRLAAGHRQLDTGHLGAGLDGLPGRPGFHHGAADQLLVPVHQRGRLAAEPPARPDRPRRAAAGLRGRSRMGLPARGRQRMTPQ